ncbi:D-Ala-D-Ala carboxypeptidase family metallohydrolase [Sporotomaculum syntrophicum]|uniref:D-Ala-D-Ala carboxypeptidase family metallohydrolase n=1 Tax=Sporotomaculum syntrophicum TaxID=182264 RepID=UPI001FAD0543|nr:D-Ala-D-Ala carboxypeptidase family metallohydrolase [Sporotomaculum syntrophicum]
MLKKNSLAAGAGKPCLVQLLEQLREQLGDKPVVITSAYRCVAHNRAVGGARQSQHLPGNAADITVTGAAPGEWQPLLKRQALPGWGSMPVLRMLMCGPGGKARWVG